MRMKLQLNIYINKVQFSTYTGRLKKNGVPFGHRLFRLK